MKMQLKETRPHALMQGEGSFSHGVSELRMRMCSPGPINPGIIVLLAFVAI